MVAKYEKHPLKVALDAGKEKAAAEMAFIRECYKEFYTDYYGDRSNPIITVEDLARFYTNGFVTGQFHAGRGEK